MCEAPLFDDFHGMACGDGGTAAISYVGCQFIGGIDRVVVAKRDTQPQPVRQRRLRSGAARARGAHAADSYGLESRVGRLRRPACSDARRAGDGGRSR
jgi:hypothetical protein